MNIWTFTSQLVAQFREDCHLVGESIIVWGLWEFRISLLLLYSVSCLLLKMWSLSYLPLHPCLLVAYVFVLRGNIYIFHNSCFISTFVRWFWARRMKTDDKAFWGMRNCPGSQLSLQIVNVLEAMYCASFIFR